VPIAEEPTDVVKRLSEALIARAPTVDVYHRYYSGQFPTPLTPSNEARAEYRRLLQQARANWCQVVVESTSERIAVDGFRIGSDPEADDLAWRIWTGSRMDAGLELLVTEAITSGVSAVMVVPTEGLPAFVAESPLETIVEYEPGSTSRRYAALKVWHDPRAKIAYASLYDDTYVYRFWAPMDMWGATNMQAVGWRPRPDVPVAAHGLGDVPIVELRNRPSLIGQGRSELESVLPLQDSVNSVLFDMLMAAHYAAFRQRWVTGMEVPVNPDTGEPVEPFDVAVNRLFVGESPDSKFGEFQATDLENYTKAIEMLVQNVASITRTPPHYLLNISGILPNSESLRAAESGLIAKVRRRSTHFGDALEDAMRMALRAGGDPRSEENIETIFRDPEFHSPGVLADATTKLVAAGIVPVQQAWQDLGYTALEQDRMQAWRAEDQLFAAGIDLGAGAS
jgi:hypothetical protein